MKLDNNQQAFFALVRAGLWEKDVCLSQFGEVDYEAILRLAEEQSIIGLVSAGLEHVKDIKVPKNVALQFVGQALQLEQQNKAMNSFVAELVGKLRLADIYALLLKGQGVAQCYERPLWRSCGDVDLLLSDENYQRAKAFLIPSATDVEPEGAYEKHLGMTIYNWVVELHGSLRSGLSSRIDKGLDAVRDSIFYGGHVRSWSNRNTVVFQPSAENDAIYIFTHVLQHFFKGGIGLRQICDWTRLLWTYRDSMKLVEVEKQLKDMRLMSEWKAFGAFAVDYLGMPQMAMPYYSADRMWSRKADRISCFILEVGNFGHNRDMSYYGEKPYIVRKVISMGRRISDLFRHAKIIPLDSLRFFPRIVYNGLKSAANGE